MTESEQEARMVRLTANLPVELLDEIKQIARSTGVSNTAVLRSMLEIGLKLRKEAKEGNKVLINRNGKPTQELVFV